MTHARGQWSASTGACETRPANQLDDDIGDEPLIDQVQEGRVEAWEIFVERYERLIYSVALGNGLSQDDAMDVTQSTFMNFLESLPAIRNKERIAWWLMTVARRQAWRVRTRNRRELPYADPRQDDVAAHTDWDSVFTLHQALDGLGQPCRDLLIALYFDPRSPSYAEIAQRLGRSVGGLGPLRGRCLARMRVELYEEDWR